MRLPKLVTWIRLMCLITQLLPLAIQVSLLPRWLQYMLLMENGMSINVHEYFSSTPTLKGQHIRFTYSSNEDEDAEGLGHSPCPGDVSVEDVIAVGSPVGSDDLSQSDEF